MKKLVVILFALLMLISQGCSKGKGGEGASGEKDRCIDYRNIAYYFAMNMIETDDTIYCLVEKESSGPENTYQEIMFSDKSYKEWLPLCTKPNCSHRGGDCEAMADSVAGITVYGDHIYYVDPMKDEYGMGTNAALCKMNTDGTQHEKLLELPKCETDFVPMNKGWSGFFTGKYLVFSYDATSEIQLSDDEYKLLRASISFVLDLETLKYKELDTSSLDWDYTGCAPLRGEGSEVYAISSFSEGDADHVVRMKLCLIDCEAASVVCLGELPEDNDIVDCGCLIKEGEMYFICWHQDVNTLEYCCMDLSSGSVTSIDEKPNTEAPWGKIDCQTGNMYRSFKKGFSKGYCGFYVCGADRNVIDSISYEGWNSKDTNLIISHVTENYIFARPSLPAVSVSGFVPTWYIDKSEIGTGNLQWHKWEPEGQVFSGFPEFYKERRNASGIAFRFGLRLFPVLPKYTINCLICI